MTDILTEQNTCAEKTDILSLMPDELADFVTSHGQPDYRATQIFTALSRGIHPSDISTLPKSFRKLLSDECVYRLPLEEARFTSQIDGTIKFLFRLYDGECIESVFMRYKHGNTLCISSQVGCRMGCAFCASTIGGKVRDLYASELYGQIIAAQTATGERISNIVMMGIGEPLDNYDNVIRFLHLVNCEGGLNIGYRHISLSTCGLADKILKLAEEDMPITLSVSFHCASDAGRSEIMPVNRKFGIDELLRACADYYRKCGRRISFEYTLIAGKNDSASDARLLAKRLKDGFRGTDAPIHVNLIRVNEVKETGFRHGSAEEAAKFAEILNRLGITATVRRRLGADVNAACGQLRIKREADRRNQKN